MVSRSMKSVLMLLLLSDCVGGSKNGADSGGTNPDANGHGADACPGFRAPGFDGGGPCPVCFNKGCFAECPCGLSPCSPGYQTTYCVDTQTDYGNCGGCGILCPPETPVCVAGQCVAGPTGYCETSCSNGLLCDKGACVAQCAAGETSCFGLCTSLLSDNNNCASCGNACPNGERCAAGLCNPTYCSTIPDYCDPIDAGGNSAPGDDGGMMTCPSGQIFCIEFSVSGEYPECINPADDPQNCGNCHSTCDESESCCNGRCVPHIAPFCDAGFCDLDPTHGLVCVNSCPEGSVICGNVCTDTDSDYSNCGGCGMSCTGFSVCVNGSCATECPWGPDG